MYLKTENLILLTPKNEEQNKKLNEIIEFCMKTRVKFDEDSVMYKIIDDFETFVSMISGGKAFTSDGTVYNIRDTNYQPFKEKKGDSNE